MNQFDNIKKWMNDCQNINQLRSLRKLIVDREHFLKYSPLRKTFVENIWFPQVAKHLIKNYKIFSFEPKYDDVLSQEIKIVYFEQIPEDNRWVHKCFDIKIPCSTPLNTPKKHSCGWESKVHSNNFDSSTNKRILLLDYNVRICNECWDNPHYGKPSVEMEDHCIDFLSWAKKFRIWELTHKVDFEDCSDYEESDESQFED